MSKGGPTLDVTPDYPGPTYVLDCLIWAKKGHSGSSNAFMFTIKKDHFIELVLEGDVSDIGTFGYTVHESWMPVDAEMGDNPSGMGDFTETFPVPVSESESK